MFSHDPFTASARRSDFEVMEDLIRRLAPLFMRVGNGPIGNDQAISPLTDEEKVRILQLFHEGKNLRDIATATGRHYNTVVKLTRELRERGAAKQVKRNPQN